MTDTTQNKIVADANCPTRLQELKKRFQDAIKAGTGRRNPTGEETRLWIQAETAQTIATCWGLNAFQLFDWANRYNVNLIDSNRGGRLCRDNSWVWRDFVADKPLQLG